MRDLCHGLWFVHKGPFRLSCTLCILKMLVVFWYRSVMLGSAVRLDAWKHENRRFGLVIT